MWDLIVQFFIKLFRRTNKFKVPYEMTVVYLPDVDRTGTYHSLHKMREICRAGARVITITKHFGDIKWYTPFKMSNLFICKQGMDVRSMIQGRYVLWLNDDSHYNSVDMYGANIVVYDPLEQTEEYDNYVEEMKRKADVVVEPGMTTIDVFKRIQQIPNRPAPRD